MTEKCFDIGTIQAFLDGELASDMSEKVACHTASCDVCAIMLAEAEEESAFAFSALERNLTLSCQQIVSGQKSTIRLKAARKRFGKQFSLVFQIRRSRHSQV
jgi:anti-sigma factor RsiW